MARNPNKSNWDILRGRRPLDTIKNRDVYGEQQLRRGHLKKMQSMRSRNILAILAGTGVAILVYIILGLFALFVGLVGGQTQGSGNVSDSSTSGYADRTRASEIVFIAKNKHGYYANRSDGVRLTDYYNSPKKIPFKPTWAVSNAKDYGVSHKVIEKSQFKAQKDSVKQHGNTAVKTKAKTPGQTMLFTNWRRVFGAIAAGLLVYILVYTAGKRNLKSQNLLRDMSDINQHKNDQHVMLPEEMMSHFEPFPDAGAHSYVQPSSLISHVALTNKGLKSVDMTQRYDKKTADKEHLVGEPMLDASGNRIKKTFPIIDTKFMDALFDASDDPDDPLIRKHYDMRKVRFKPMNVGDAKYWSKKNVKTVADLINEDWDIPDYETQRPAGAYFVDSSPANTMVLAITRAGKGKIA